MIPRLHLITGDEILRRGDFLDRAIEVLERGGSAVAFHVRGPGTSGRVIHDVAHTLAGPASRWGSALLVNDRLDVALTLRHAGTHLGQRSLPPSVARRLLGPERTLGLSVHDAAEAGLAGRGDVDFLVVGTVFATSSHPAREPGGLERIREVAGAAPGVPLVAIGGVTPQRVAGILAAGAHGVAVLSGIWASEEPSSAVRDYLDALREAV